MSTGTVVCRDALYAGGISSNVNPPSAEQYDIAFRRLMGMLNMWLSKGIVLNFTPIDAIGQELDEPLDAYNGIVDNLAVNLLHFYKLPVPKELATNAKVNYNDIRTMYQELIIPSLVPSSTLPRGQGNSKGIDAQVFWNPNSDSLGN